MSAEANKKVVQQFCDAMAAADPAAAFALLTPDAIWWIPTDQLGGVTRTAQQMSGGVSAFVAIFQRFPKFSVTSMTAEDDRVSVEQNSREGLTHGGAAYGNDYHMFFRLKDSKIIEVKEYMNPIMAGPIMAELQGAQAQV